MGTLLHLQALNKLNGVAQQLKGNKELLQARETFWQSRLHTLQPDSLSKRMG